jgi:hypothetical protein
MRRGTHDRADANGPCRGCATAVSCRAASRTSRSACPLPSLPCTLQIGGAILKSRATCDSPVLPRSPTDVPAPCGQRRCRVHPEHCCKLQAEAIRGLQPRSDRNDCDGDARTCHRRRLSRRKPAAACGTRASRMHSTRNMQLAGSPAVASRPAEAARCLESRESTRTRVYHPQYARCQRECPEHIAGPYQCATNASLKLDGRDWLAPCASLRPYRWTPRGRMRGVGATCTAPTTHGRTKRMAAPECCKTARDERVAAFPSERRRSPRSDRSLGVSPAHRRDWLAACNTMHQYSRSARRGACSAGRVIGTPRYSARRAKLGFGGEFGGSRVARADETGAWM